MEIRCESRVADVVQSPSGFVMQLAGATDDSIDDRLAATLLRYSELIRTELSGDDHSDKVFPGIAALLDALEARDDVVIGLLTGNIHDGAVAKLDAVGLGTRRFKIGAFGSDHASRPELPAIARARAEALLGHAVDGADVVILGDTPADMTCGRAIGARALGVATGRYSVEALEAHNAAAVFPNFSDTDAVMRAIMAE